MVREKLIFAKQSLKNKEEVIKFIADAANKEGLLNDEDGYIEAVHNREKEISTSIGYGIAIPHGKTDAVKEPFISFMSLKKPFEWDSTMKDQVEAVFMIGVPAKNAGMLHLKAIAAISKKLMSEEFRNKLYAAQTSHEAYELLHEIDKSIDANA